jgi:hypothetical protein
VVCTTLGSHHRDEDAVLFPWLSAAHPELGEVVDRLEHDHRMIGTLLFDLERVVRERAGREVVLRHLEGVDAIMESHFPYEERELVVLLDAVGADPASNLRSAMRLNATAADRAPTIATTIHSTCHGAGNPRAASTAPRKANGNAKSVCSILIISRVRRVFLITVDTV